MPPMPAGVEEGIVQGIYRLSARDADQARGRVQLFGSGAILRSALRGPADPRRPIRRGERRVERDQLQRTGRVTPRRAGAGTCCTPPNRRGNPIYEQVDRGPDGSVLGGVGLRAGGARAVEPIHAGRHLGAWGRTAWAEANRGRPCGATSRWMPNAWWWRPCTAWQAEGRFTPRRVAQAIRDWESIRKSGVPCTPSDHPRGSFNRRANGPP